MARPLHRIFSTMLVAAAVAGCDSGAANGAPGPHGAPPPVPVTTAAAVSKNVAIRLGAVGEVVPMQTVSIRPRVGGEIVAVGFQKGQEVQAGDVLFRIDPRPYRTALVKAQAQLRRDQVLAANAEVDSHRYAKLAEGGLVGSQQADEARTSVDALGASVALDRATLEEARLNLEYTTIRSPIEGRTGDVLVHEGNVVSPSSPEPLVVVNQLRPIDVSFSVPEQNLPDIRARQASGALRVEARAPNQGSALTGELTFVDNAVDRSTGMIRLKATFANADGALWPGQYVDVVLLLGERAGAVVVPAAAVMTGQDGRYLYVVQRDGTAVIRPVEVTTIDEQEAVIARGVTVGETVVTDGQFRLVPGSRVSPTRPRP